MQTTQTLTPSDVRFKLERLTVEISSITPVKVMANPMMIQKTALRTCELMAEMLVLIESQSPHVDAGQNLG